ncbi:MAG: O-antigen ligase family protein [Elusimicrobia bacterium]|nr:O-antigen ligase family protein [Elusimicrobiota bacterium]
MWNLWSKKPPWPETLQGAGLGLLALSLPLSVAGINLGWALATVGWLGVWARKGSAPQWKAMPLFGAVLAYLLAALVSSILGGNLWENPRWIRSDLHRVWLYLALSQLINPRWTLRLTFLYLIASALAGLGASSQALSRYLSEGWLIRAHTFVHSLTFAEQMLFAFLGSLSFLAFRRKLGRGLFWAALLCGLLSFGGLFLSQSRGPWLACLPALGILAWQKKSIRRILPIFMFPLIVTFLLPISFSQQLRERAQSIFSLQFSSNHIRLRLWQIGWAAFEDHPWWGVGAGNFRYVFPDYHEGPLFRKAIWSEVHNQYLQHAAERGMGGLAVLLYLFGSLWVLSYRMWCSSPSPWTLWALAGATAFCFFNLTESAFQDSEIWAQMVWVFVLAQTAASSAEPALSAAPSQRSGTFEAPVGRDKR